MRSADVFDGAEADGVVEFNEQGPRRYSSSELPVRSCTALMRRLSPVGFHDAGVDTVHLHAVGFAAVGEAFGKGRNRRIDRAADGELRRGACVRRCRRSKISDPRLA